MKGEFAIVGVKWRVHALWLLIVHHKVLGPAEGFLVRVTQDTTLDNLDGLGRAAGVSALSAACFMTVVVAVLRDKGASE